jgi:hypothetical protein
MARSDWLTPRGTSTHQGVFISSKKFPYGVGLTLMSPPTTDQGQTGDLSDPHLTFLEGRFSFFAIHILTSFDS